MTRLFNGRHFPVFRKIRDLDPIAPSQHLAELANLPPIGAGDQQSQDFSRNLSQSAQTRHRRRRAP